VSFCNTFPARRWLGGLAALALLVATAIPGHSGQGQTPRDKQIADLIKQIDDLTKKLNDLKQQKDAPALSSADGTLPAEWIKSMTWRSIGPATMGGRITALAVYEADPCCYYVATASGGLLKTVNNGVTFEHQFDREATVSIGDVCVAPSDRNIVWVGTGEANPRNSVSYGDGVYKSVDGGKTWKNMGLKKSFQIGKILIHPTNPNIVYVGALGRLYGPNQERGLYKTTDGGQTWDRVLFVNDRTGVIDMVMNPQQPDTLIVATWERQRDGHDSFVGEPKPPDGIDGYDPAVRWGPGSGLHKTTDGGKTFTKLSNGLPACEVGRIGLDLYRKDPKVLYAIIDSSRFGMGPPLPPINLGARAFDAKEGTLLFVQADSPAANAGLQTRDLLLEMNNKPVTDSEDFLDRLVELKVGDKLTMKVKREMETKEVTLTLEKATGDQPNIFGGSRTRPYGERLGAQRANAQNRQGPDGHQYGGLYRSADGGETWKRVNSINPRPMYFSVVRVDPSDEKYLYVLGVQLYRSSDGGRRFKADGSRGVHADQHALWINPKDGRHMIVGSDGGFYATYDRMEHWDYLNHLALGQFYHVAVDNRKPYRVYGGLQDNASWGGPSHTLNGSGPINEDWMFINGGDGFVCRADPTDPDVIYAESQDGRMMRRNLKTGQTTAIGPGLGTGTGKGMGKGKIMGKAQQPRHRFNWNTPFILSHHNPKIYYCAAEVVFKSLKQGDELRIISPEITRTKRGSATALAESPKNPEVLYVGSDDGALWVTRDGGVKWVNIADKVGLPGPRWVATIEPSRFVEGRCYVTFDAHRSDDDEPYVYVTEDFGQNWQSLRANLPTGSSRVLREDVLNPNLLYVGTEFAIWASVNRGASWAKLNNNLPTVAVHEIAVHPTAGEIVAATHGRSLWVLDVKPLRQMNAGVFKAKATLFEPQAATRWRQEPGRGSPFGSGSRRFVGQNPPPGARFYYALAQEAQEVNVKVFDINGKILRNVKGRKDAGLHRATWDLSRPAAKPKAGGKRPAGDPPPGRPGTLGGFTPRPAVPPGDYRVVLTVDGQEYARTFRVEADPNVPQRPAVMDDDEEADEPDRAPVIH
jgi:photosystem II stability/assembly factor-like uncharacterized protein